MINLTYAKGPNYTLVQSQIMGTITKHLPEGSWTRSSNERVEGALNFALFIGQDAEVLMSHGVADKSYHWRSDRSGNRLNNGRHRTDLLVPGKFLADRIAGAPRLDIDRDHVHVVGWPRLDLLLEQQRSLRQRAARLLRPRRRTTILWAPTHDFVTRGEEKITLSSYPAFEPYVEQLQKRYDVTVSLHPRNREEKQPTDQALLDADVVISDFGTMVYEAWALGKQVIFPYWLIGDRIAHYHPRSSEGRIFRERIGLHADSFEELVAFIEAKTPVDDRTRAYLDSYLDPQYLGTSGRRIAELLQQLDRQRG